MNLAPAKRYRVVYRPEGAKRSLSAVVLGLRPPTRCKMLGFPVLSFGEQERGDLHVIAVSLVESVLIEQQDRHTGDWHRVGVWEHRS